MNIQPLRRFSFDFRNHIPTLFIKQVLRVKNISLVEFSNMRTIEFTYSHTKTLLSYEQEKVTFDYSNFSEKHSMLL